MKWNREKTVAALALVLLLVSAPGIVRGLLDPAAGLRDQDFTPSRSARGVLFRKYRTFRTESPSERDPFAYSEGWARLEPAPLPPPPLPPLSRPLLLPAYGGDFEDWGIVLEGRSSAEAKRP
jgi:hypothetical protein